MPVDHKKILRDRASSKSVYAKQRDELNAAADYIEDLEEVAKLTQQHQDQIARYAETRSAQDQAKSMCTGTNLLKALEKFEEKHG